MKQYVFDFAADMMLQDLENELMREDVREDRKQSILAVLDNYKEGCCTTVETMYLIAKIC